jgi:hypothetical protein
VEAAELVLATSEVVLTAAGVEVETGAGADLELEILTASTGAAATEVEAGATEDDDFEEVERVVGVEDEEELVGGSLVSGIAELQTEGGYSIMPSVMVETGVPN